MELQKQKLQDDFLKLTDSIKLNPRNIQLLIRRGNKYLEQNLLSEAIKDFLVAQKIDPKNEKLSINLDNTYLLNGQLKEALPEIEKLMALKIIPIEAFFIRAKQRMQSKKYIESLADLNYYIESKGYDNEAYLLRAKVNYLLDKKMNACEDINQYEKLTGTSPESLRKEICGK
jgi:tetratricopeptide (TPR) repeat protein